MTDIRHSDDVRAPMNTHSALGWKTTSTSLRELRRLARPHSDMTSAFGWLKAVGLVPEDVQRMDIRQVLTDLDPEDISVKYLAAAAYEWDTWGPASPDQFIRAISAEARGAKRDLITETLTMLGREMQAVAS